MAINFDKYLYSTGTHYISNSGHDERKKYTGGAASGYGIAFPLKLVAGQTYFLSGTGDEIVGTTYYDENGELISYQNNRLNKTITVPENTTTTLIGFYANTSNTDFTFSDIQLELGSTATAYEPYNGTTIPIDWITEAGTIYGGYVDLANGELVQTWNYIRANERTWNNYSAYQVFYTDKSDRSADSRDISDKLKSYTGYGWSNAPDNSIISGNRNSMFIKHLGVSSNAEFKEWLDEVDPIIYYELAEPIHYTLTPPNSKPFAEPTMYGLTQEILLYPTGNIKEE